MFRFPILPRAARRARRAAATLPVAAAALLAAGCNTAATPSLPTPTFRAEVGVRFPLRAGDLGLVVGPTNYLYVSLGAVGLDRRCAADPCEEPGFLNLDLELETRERQGGARIRTDDAGEGLAFFDDFEIRSHQVAPAPRAERIPLTDYAVLLSVRERETPPEE